MKTCRVLSAPMRFPKHLALWFAVFAVRSASAAEPVPSGKPEPSPALPLAPAPPPPDPDKVLPLGDPIPRTMAPPSLLPDEIPAATKRPAPAGPPAAGKPGSSLKPQATAADLDLRIRYRKARNVAETNGKVRAAWDDSRDAKTDHDKRQALKRYYDVLFGQMLAMDRGIAPLVEQRRKAEFAPLTQTHIAPTVPGG